MTTQLAPAQNPTTTVKPKEPTMKTTTLPTHDDLADWLIDRVACYLNADPDTIETDKALGDYGMDSVFALNLCTDLEFEFGILAEPTVAWDYPTIDDIAGHLTEDLGT
jgi:acyl carrier protein